MGDEFLLSTPYNITVYIHTKSIEAVYVYLNKFFQIHFYFTNMSLF